MTVRTPEDKVVHLRVRVSAMDCGECEVLYLGYGGSYALIDLALPEQQCQHKHMKEVQGRCCADLKGCAPGTLALT